MELLKFIFSSFWYFLGFVIIMAIFLESINTIVSNIIKLIIFFKNKNKE